MTYATLLGVSRATVSNVLSECPLSWEDNSYEKECLEKRKSILTEKRSWYFEQEHFENHRIAASEVTAESNILES